MTGIYIDNFGQISTKIYNYQMELFDSLGITRQQFKTIVTIHRYIHDIHHLHDPISLKSLSDMLTEPTDIGYYITDDESVKNICNHIIRYDNVSLFNSFCKSQAIAGFSFMYDPHIINFYYDGDTISTINAMYVKKLIEDNMEKHIKIIEYIKNNQLFSVINLQWSTSMR